MRKQDRARVVVAEDHASMRKAIEDFLSSSFDVVAAVGDGRRALEAVHRLDPDVVILDITMPVLDGLAVARALVERGARAKIVFLSVHGGDEYVAAAVNAGGHGYVVKSRLVIDLQDTVQHALADRLRVPTSSSLLRVADRRAKHAVQFYRSDDDRLDTLQPFAARALKCGDTVVAVGRPALLSGMSTRLASMGFDLGSLSNTGRYQTLDAEEYLPRIMRGDEPDEASVIEIVHGLGAKATAADGESRRVVVFGEVAPLLLRDGNVDGALAIERIWHSHASFHTLCSYCRTDLKTGGRGEIFDQLCAVHHAVIS